MDLYDLGHYFTSYVPIEALKSPLLRYSAVAIAAKQLGRVRGVKATIGAHCQKQASTEVYPNCEGVNWFYIAAKYYDKAIAYLRKGLVKAGCPGVSPPSPTDAVSKRARADDCQSQSTQTDDLLAATSILSVYEFMSDSNIEWSRSVFTVWPPSKA